MRRWILFVSPLIALSSVQAQERPAFPVAAVLRSAEAPESPIAPYALPDATSRATKSKALGVLYSALLPGMGELYADAYETGRYFTIAEAALWLGYAGMSLYGTAQKNDAHTFAAAHAGADPAGKDDQYFTNVANFTNTEQYNDKKARDGNYTSIYSGSTYQWQWDTEDNRVAYRSMNLSATALIDNTKYVAAAIVLNHLASAIDAVLQVNRYNRSLTIGAAPAFDRGAMATRLSLRVAF